MIGMQTSSVAPGYTVDSKTTVVPRVICRPTDSLADIRGPKSGWCASSTGVGTATTMKSASLNLRGSVVTDKCRAALSSSRLTSPVGSQCLSYAATFSADTSNPIVGYLLPNSTARG